MEERITIRPAPFSDAGLERLRAFGHQEAFAGCAAYTSAVCSDFGFRGLGGELREYGRIDGLRYAIVIVMTDTDVDGAHIASLLMTFFFVQMRPMIDAGHLFLGCPPLYRLTQGAKRVYCLDGEERDA